MPSIRWQDTLLHECDYMMERERYPVDDWASDEGRLWDSLQGTARVILGTGPGGGEVLCTETTTSMRGGVLILLRASYVHLYVLQCHGSQLEVILSLSEGSDSDSDSD